MSFHGDRPRNGFRISLIFRKPFFLVTVTLHLFAWPLTFIAQCLAEAKHHSAGGSSSLDSRHTPLGIGWFSIFYQALLFGWIVSCVARDEEQELRSQISTLVTVNVVCGVIACNQGIYEKQSVMLLLFGVGWLLLSILNLLWLLYFTCPENSRLFSLFNPGHQRKQLIRSSINLRRPEGSFDDISAPHTSVAYTSPYDAGAQDLTPSVSNDHTSSNIHSIKASRMRTTWLPDEQSSSETYGGVRFQTPHPISSTASLAPLVSSQPAVVQESRGSHTLHREQDNIPSLHPYSGFEGSYHQHVLQDPANPSSVVGPRQQPLHFAYHAHNGLSAPLNPEDQHGYRLANAPQGQKIGPPMNTKYSQAPSTHKPTTSAAHPAAAFMPIESPLQTSQRYDELSGTSSAGGNLASVSTTSLTQNTHGPALSPQVKRAKALYEYFASATDPNEISFTKGEILEIRNHSGKWWQATKTNGQCGIVPSNYMQMLE